MTRLRSSILLATACTLATSGCPSPSSPPPAAVPTSGWQAVVGHAPFAGDTVIARVTLDGLDVSDDLLGLAGSDWDLTVADGDPWLLGRFFIDTIRRYDGLDLTAPTLEFSTGAGTNPHALAVCGGRLFVSRYDLTEDLDAGGDVAMYDLDTGVLLGTTDLSAYNPHSDGTPEPDGLVHVGESVFVNLQLRDRNNSWEPDPTSKVLEIDCSTGAVTGEWDVGSDSSLREIPDRPATLQIVHEHGVQHLDTSDGSVTDVLLDADLGAGFEVLSLSVSGDDALLVAEVDQATNEVWCVDLSSGDRTMLGSYDHRSWGARTAPDGLVWVLWRDHWATDSVIEVGGIAIYDPATCTEVTAGWLRFSADPISLIFYDAGQ